MGFQPITVNKGPGAEPHIYAEDDASIFQCMFGEDGILDIGSKLELSIQSNNLVRMSDGVLCIGGHIGRVKYADYADLTIDNGETGYNRNDLIIGSFSNTGEHTIDTFEPQIVKGTPATGDAVDPTLTEGSLYEGDHLRQRAIARVKLEGLNIVGIDMLLPVIPSIPRLKALLDELNGKSLKLATFRETYTINANAIRKIQLSKSDFEVADDTTFLAVWCECDTPNPSVYTSSVTPDLRLYVANSTQSGTNIPVNVFALYK